MKYQARRNFLAVALAVLCSVFVIGQVQATTTSSPAVIKGTSWLQAQVQNDGSLLNEALSIATPLQNRAESLETLKALATVPSPLADQLAADATDNTEYLARRAFTLSQAGRDTSAITQQLLAKQNLDGGFGGATGYVSDPLDTALVMLAMSQNSLAGSPAAQAARSYLISAIQSDGGMGTGSDSQRINASALALLALQSFPQDLVTATALKQIDSWLLLKQGSDGSWLGNSNLTALSLAAISPMLTDPTISTTATTYLTGLQVADGSWGDDPFLTAVVLRALNAAPPASAPATSAITGMVVDSNTTAALAGAAISLSGPAAASAVTATSGNFNIASLPSGTYTLQVSDAGYNSYSNTYQVNTSQTLNIGTIALSQAATGGIVTGAVTDAATGHALAGATVTVNSASAVTDSNGMYKIANVTPGAATLSASMTGYTSTSVTGMISGGQTLAFSPALYAAGVTAPTTGTFTGRVVAAGTNLPLAGVSINLNGTAAGTTAADGTFSLTLAPASYNTIFALTGYSNATAAFVLTVGSTVNAGTVTLTPQQMSTNISGTVTDATTGNPINAAQVQVLNGPVVTAGTNGTYTLSGLGGTTFDLRVSATGYVSQSVQLTVPQPMNITQNFPLQVETGQGLSIGGLLANPASLGSNANVTASTVVSNASAGTAAAVVFTMQIINAQGKVIGTGAAYDQTGTTMLGQVTINPGQQLPIMFKWNTGQFPPGAYTLVANVVAAGSISRATPSGTVLVQGQGTLNIVPDPHFSGTITADPPVLQTGSTTPVQLSAILANDGNALLPAQTYQLTITNTATNTVVATEQVNGAAFVPGALQALTFSAWTPTTGGGNFRIDVQISGSAYMGDVVGKVYVGDAATGTFTVNQLAVPAGTQVVQGDIHVVGQDNTQGTISDPFAPLIKAAIQRAVTYDDAQASAFTSGSRCLACHVQTQALVGGEMTRSLTTYNVAQRRTIFEMIATSQQNDGSIYTTDPQYPGFQTMLGLWALNAWHNKADVATILAKGAVYLQQTQAADGSWPTNNIGMGWWQPTITSTAFDLKSLIDIKQTLAQAPAGSVESISFEPWAPGFNTLMEYYPAANYNGARYLLPDTVGNIYVSVAASGVVAMTKPDGSVVKLMSGVNYPQQMALGTDGSLYVATASGLMRRAPDGTVTTVTPNLSFDPVTGPDGNIYVMSIVPGAVYWWGQSYSRVIFQISPQGTMTPYFTVTSIGAWQGPYAMQFDTAGRLVMVNGTDVYTINADKSYSYLSLNNGPVGGWVNAMIPDGDGWLVAQGNNLYHYDSDWTAVKVASPNGGAIYSLARLPNGAVMASDAAYIYTLTNTPSYLPIKVSGATLGGVGKAAAVDAAGNIYITSTGDANNWGSLALLTPDGTIKVLSGMGEPNKPVFASDGSLYIPSYFGVTRYVPSTGQMTMVTSMHTGNLALGPDGNIYAVPMASNKIVQITPAGIVSDYIVGGPLNAPDSIAFDSSGGMLVSNSGANNVVRFNADKSYSVVITNTNGAANAILADGAGYLVGTPYGLFRYDGTSQTGTIVVGGAIRNLTRAPDGTIYVGDNSANLYTLAQIPAGSQLDANISKATNWLLADNSFDATNNLQLAHLLIGLGEANKYYAGTALSTTIQKKMAAIGDLLKSNQLADGGWGKTTSYASDSMVTAQVGVALDYLNIPASDPVFRNAVSLLLNRQQADGSWISENGLFTTHYAATTWVAIWLPIALDRLGGIDTDMTVSMPANVTLANPSMAPASSAPNAAGGVDYLWHLQGVKSAGVDVSFDLTLDNMVLGEARPVASNAWLTFNNTFTNQPTTALIAIPRVTASAFLGVGVTTDQVSYPANTPVNITAAANNTSAVGTLDGSVKLEVYSADNYLAGVVGTYPFSGLAAGAQTSLTGTWGTAANAAGNYYVLATLYDAQNRFVGTAKSAFSIVGGSGGAVPGFTGVGATISVDKQSYQPVDRVQIANRITDLTQNQAFTGLQAMVTVYRPDGTVLWTQTAALQQLLAASFIDLPESLQLASTPAGQYHIVLSVLNSSGSEVARAVTGFTVLSSALTGAGLTGTVGALPKIVPQTDPVVLNWTANNAGNTDLSALPLTLSIVDPTTKQVMAQQTYAINLAQGKSYQTAFTWDTSTANVGSGYIAILSANIGGKDVVLAQDGFLVTYPPVKLGVTQSTVRENRVLVWLACNPGEGLGTGEGAGSGENGQTSGGNARGGNAGHAEGAPLCLQTRAAFLDNLLTQLKVTHLITTNRADFRKAFREGKYNVYWLSGDIKLADGKALGNSSGSEASVRGQGKGQGKGLDGTAPADGRNARDDLAEEIREAVNRGDSLILDGVKHGGTSLQEAAGIAYGGQLGNGQLGEGHQPGAALQLTTLGDLFAVQTLPTAGLPQQIQITTGRDQADFTTQPDDSAHKTGDGNGDAHQNANADAQHGAGNAPDSGKPQDPGKAQNASDKPSGDAANAGDHQPPGDTHKPTWPAIVSNAYGKGHALVFGFDLVDALQNGSAPAAWQAELQTSLGYLLPQLPNPYSGGAWVTLETDIQNQARTVPLGVDTLLPDGSTLLQTVPQAVPDANGQPTWNFTLPEAATQTLLSTLRLPRVTGDHKALTTIDSYLNGAKRRYGEYTYDWTVAAADTLGGKVAADLTALTLTSGEEIEARAAALAKLQRAMSLIGNAQYGQAIVNLLLAIDQVRKIGSVDLSGIRLELDDLLQQTEWDWLRTGGAAASPGALGQDGGDPGNSPDASGNSPNAPGQGGNSPGNSQGAHGQKQNSNQ